MLSWSERSFQLWPFACWFHCMTVTWSSFMFLVRFVDKSLDIDAACSTTDLGLNHCVTACQAWSPSPGLTLRILLTSVATSTGARDQSSCHSCTQLLDIPEAPHQDCNRVVFELIQLGNFSQQRTTLSIRDKTTALPSIRNAKSPDKPASTELLRQVSPSLPVVQSPIVLWA